MKKELLNKISNDCNTQRLLLAQLQNELDNETAKPSKLRDYDKIDALSCEIAELLVGKEQLDAKTQAAVSLLTSKSENPAAYKKSRRFRPLLVSLCSCAAILIGLNTVTLSTSGMNLFSAIVKYSKDAVHFTLSEEPSASVNGQDTLPSHTYDDFGILRKCEEFNISPDVPHYIPEGFSLTDFNYHEMKNSDDLYFTFTKDKVCLNFSYQSYRSGTDIPPQLIPSDNHDFSSITINGSEAFILQENGSYTAIYRKNNIVCIYSCDGMEYDEFISVINSVK